ncbi:MAG: 2-amino-4-hydroxy-6-hydroxymethyldihydropteridine diphosphokinase [Methyloceanibacter sp.]
MNRRSKIVIGLGANERGVWGNPAETIAHALGEMRRAGIDVAAVSPLYVTAPVGGASQPPYVNAAALLDARLSPEALLRALKAIERRAGRRGGRPWGRRTLDIDIVDYGGQVRHWRFRRPAYARAGARPLTLPHPLAHRRPFVLRPLADIAPDWRHPVLKASARELWRRVSRQGQGAVLRPL